MDVLDLFDRIVVISLEERKDRRDRLTANLRDLLPRHQADAFEFFDALRFRDSGPFSTAGIRGCFMSHLEVLQQSERQGVQRLLIVEDDARFLPSCISGDASWTAGLRDEPWDVVQLGWQEETPLFVADVSSAPGLHNSHVPITGAHCVGFAQPALSAFTRHLEECLIGTPGDTLRGPMGNDGALNTFCWINPETIRVFATPLSVVQRPTRSDLHPRWFDFIPGLSTVAEAARRRTERLQPAQSSPN